MVCCFSNWKRFFWYYYIVPVPFLLVLFFSRFFIDYLFCAQPIPIPHVLALFVWPHVSFYFRRALSIENTRCFYGSYSASETPSAALVLLPVFSSSHDMTRHDTTVQFSSSAGLLALDSETHVLFSSRARVFLRCACARANCEIARAAPVLQQRGSAVVR